MTSSLSPPLNLGSIIYFWFLSAVLLVLFGLLAFVMPINFAEENAPAFISYIVLVGWLAMAAVVVSDYFQRSGYSRQLKLELIPQVIVTSAWPCIYAYSAYVHIWSV